MNRRMRGRRLGMLSAVGALFAGVAPAAFAQEARPLLVLERDSLPAMLPAEKDQRLVEALSMLPDRLSELSRELPAARGVDVEAAGTLLDALARPGRMGIVYSPENGGGGVFGYNGMLSVESGERQPVEGIERLVNAALDKGALPFERRESERLEGMSELQLPFGALTFGPRQRGDRWSYDALVGSSDAVEAGFEALPEPAMGMRPVIRGAMDLRALNPAVDTVRSMAGGKSEELNQMLGMLENCGLIGENALRLDFQLGYDGRESLGQYRLLNAREHASALGLPTGSLDRSHLGAIPRDAVVASIARMDLADIEHTIDAMARFGAPVENQLAAFQEMTGVDLRQDILGTLGGTAAFYMSDTTGGGGVFSSVMMMTFKDRERFLRAHDKLVGFARGMLEAEAPERVSRYVAMESWREAGVELRSLRFKGLPVPLEVSYATTDEWLIAGLTPQAVIAAVRQARADGGSGILSHPGVRAALDGRTEVSSLNFTDVERLARDGYPLVSLFGSGVANAMRSPSVDRDPGMIVPTFSELVGDARPTVDYSYWSGDDLITQSHGDRSMLVQVAALGGLAGRFAPLVGAGVALPAIGEARERARRLGAAGDAFERLELAGRAARAAVFLSPFERAGALTLLTPRIETLGSGDGSGG